MDYKELTRKLNEFREKGRKENKTYTSQQLYEELEKLGFNVSISRRVAAFMDFEKIGTAKIYSMPESPIHQSRIERLYRSAANSQKKSKAMSKIAKAEDLTEQQAVAILIKKGYRVKKAIRFDLERFKAEQPEMYRKYCIYEYL